MSSILPSIAILGLVALAALQLTVRRASATECSSARVAAARALGLATAVQAGHFAEEWATGFHARFPALFGLEPMPVWFFVSFNSAWLLIWLGSLPLLRSGRAQAFFAAWFLAIAAVLNGLAHPALAAFSGGYFPGLVTSPFAGLAGIYLWRRLRIATHGQ